MDTEALRDLADDVFDIDHHLSTAAWRAMHAAADELDRLREAIRRIATNPGERPTREALLAVLSGETRE